MGKAISEGSCDLVGMARPLTAEFSLPNDMISGKTTRAKANHVFEGVQTASSYLQLWEVRLRFAISRDAARLADALGSFRLARVARIPTSRMRRSPRPSRRRSWETRLMHSCTVRCGPRRHDPQALDRCFTSDLYTCTSHRNAQLFYMSAGAARAEENPSLTRLVNVGR